MHDWIALTGDIGTVLFALAVLFITYVALARKRIVPVIGSIRGWMYAHIVSAIASFFLVSIHSGNYFAWFKRQGARLNEFPDRTVADVVPHVAFLNSFIFLVVIVSGLVGATMATLWNYIFNLMFDHGLKRFTGTTRKTLKLRFLHAISFEFGLMLALLPVIAWWLDIGLLEALVVDIAFVVFYLVYAFVFTWCYDTVFPDNDAGPASANQTR